LKAQTLSISDKKLGELAATKKILFIAVERGGNPNYLKYKTYWLVPTDHVKNYGFMNYFKTRLALKLRFFPLRDYELPESCITRQELIRQYKEIYNNGR